MLAEAQWWGLRRRIGRAATGNPLVAAGVVLLLLATPVLAILAGRGSARALGGSLGDPDVALSLSATAAFVAALSGALLATIAPGEEALGEQLAASPLTRRERFWGMTAVPMLCALASVVPLAALFLLPFAAVSPGGMAAGLGGLALSGGVLAMAAATVQGVVAARRGAPVGLLAVGAVGVTWALAGAASGEQAAVGPFGWLPATLAGERSPLVVVALGLALGVGFAAVWVALCLITAPEAPIRRHDARRTLVPRRYAGAILSLGLLRVVRRPELRRHAVLVIVATAGGALLLSLVVPTSLSFIVVFCSATAIVGAAVSPLSAVGLDARGDWLWATVPASPHRRLLSHAAALVAGWLIVVAACAPLLILARVDASTLVDLATLTAVVLPAALVAGAVLPWREGGGGEQMLSYAAFLAVAAASWAALGWLARQGSAQGLSDTVVAALFPLTGLVLGLGLSSWIAGRS